MKAIRLTVGPLLAAWVLAAQAVSAQDAPRKDFQVALDCLSAIMDYDNYDIFDDVTVHVKSGVTTLTGKVTLPNKRTEIEKRVTRVKGVTVVRNQIDVLPASKFDQDLRLRIANAIYNNASFYQYASLRNKPIHVIVEGIRVTLTGVVHSDVDRKVAQSLAMQAGAGKVTNLLKTDAEARQGFEE